MAQGFVCCGSLCTFRRSTRFGSFWLASWARKFVAEPGRCAFAQTIQVTFSVSGLDLPQEPGGCAFAQRWLLITTQEGICRRDLVRLLTHVIYGLRFSTTFAVHCRNTHAYELHACYKRQDVQAKVQGDSNESPMHWSACCHTKTHGSSVKRHPSHTLYFLHYITITYGLPSRLCLKVWSPLPLPRYVLRYETQKLQRNLLIPHV